MTFQIANEKVTPHAHHFTDMEGILLGERLFTPKVKSKLLHVLHVWKCGSFDVDHSFLFLENGTTNTST